jgi:serine/threonine-protein kinase
MDSGPRQPTPARVGRYWLFRVFARGGMASVHLGRLVGPAGFSRLVALKLLHPIYAHDDDHYTMLLDEARLSSRVRHPNVVQTLDVVHDGENLCIVMEYVHGVTLASALESASRRGERVPAAIVSAVLVGALHGLHAAHEARGEDGASLGIVHRDVSPQNVLVGVDGLARVLDFGVAKALRKDHVTIEGRIKGKVAYMPPEQLLGGTVTRQADVYSAGVVLWEAVVGRRLFEDLNEARLLARALGEGVPPPSAFAAETTAALDAVVVRACAADPAQRFRTAQEMAAALAGAVRPASPEAVARWIARVAGDALAARDELVHETESFVGHEPSLSDSDWDEASDPAHGEIAVTLSPVDPEAPTELALRPPPPRPRGRRAAIASSVVALAVGAGLVAVLGRAPPPERSGRTIVETVATVAVLEPPRAIDPGDAPPATIAAASPGGKRAARPAHPATRAASRVPSATSSCVPPFTIDADGIKHYKPACLR